MTRSVNWIAVAVILTGLLPFLWKTVLLDLPVFPRGASGVWHVQLEIDVRGSAERGSVVAILPTSDAGQTLFDLRIISDGLEQSMRDTPDGRSAVWSGSFSGARRLGYAFRVHLHGRQPDDVREQPVTDAQRRVAADTVPAAWYEFLDRLDVAPADDAQASLRVLFGFVADEIATVEGGSDDALLALAAREGSARGQAHMLAALLGAAGIPARTFTALRLTAPVGQREFVFVEGFVGGRWVGMFPSLGLLDEYPKDLLVLAPGGQPLVSATGADAVAWRYRQVRERLQPDELAAFMKPPVALLELFSLYRLPVSTQALLRLLLALPLGCLIIAAMRNLVGIAAFGTFLPVLFALAMRNTGLLFGLGMLATVLVVGVAGRLALDRLHLLFVPRVSILLCVVILCIATFALLGFDLGSGDLLTGVLFPIVILAVLIERFSITTMEEGVVSAMRLLGGSALLSACVYPVFVNDNLLDLFFGYPELVICVIGVLILLGRYAGYRLMELFRFRMFNGPSPYT